MKELVLRPLEQPACGLSAESISCDVFAGKSVEEIEALEVYSGNRRRRLGDFFSVSGEAGDTPEETRIVIEGDVPRTKWIGRGMSAGEILVKGSTGMYTGAWMRGGRILVQGSVDSFAGMMMSGGELEVQGDAGDYLGCAYRGEWKGMRGGSILVHGNAGSEAGHCLSGGRVTVMGRAESFAGVRMRSGLLVLGSAESRVGAQMTGGSIVVLSRTEMLPSFELVDRVSSPEIEGVSFEGVFEVYAGDLAERNPKGRVYLKVE